MTSMPISSCRYYRGKIYSDIKDLREKIDTTKTNQEAFAGKLLEIEARVAKLEGATPPPPPPPNGDWKDRIQINEALGNAGEIVFEVKGLTYFQDDPHNPSKPGKNSLLTLTRPPLDLRFQEYSLELRKYAILTEQGDLINKIHLKARLGGKAFEDYMPYIPDWDPTTVYKMKLTWDTDFVCAEIEDGVLHYGLSIRKDFEISPPVLILGANPKYSAPPGAKFRLISY